MRRLLGVAVFMVSAGVGAAPFVVADVVAGVSSCGVTMDGQAQAPVSAAGNQCKFDIGGVSNGQHTITMTALTVNDPVWGTQESAPSAPFVFAKPAAPAVPGNLRLVQ